MEELMLTDSSSSPEICVDEIEKNYYCQRCLNHGELNPRKGHKPECGYLKCPCAECTMVEQRRQLNNLLSKKKIHCTPTTMTRNGKRVRDPHCARCSAHGVLVPLRGHKRTMCQFVTCTCTLCALVENRRMLMAAQIKLRRLQQKTRDGKEPKVRRSRKKKMEVDEVEEVTVVAAAQIDKRQDSSSPCPSTIDTMSPSLSISPPPSPLPLPLPLPTSKGPPGLLAPVPLYPFPFVPPISPTATEPTVIPMSQLILSYLQQQQQQLSPSENCHMVHPVIPTISAPQIPGFLMPEQLGTVSLLASFYLKNCMRI